MGGGGRLPADLRLVQHAFFCNFFASLSGESLRSPSATGLFIRSSVTQTADSSSRAFPPEQTVFVLLRSDLVRLSGLLGSLGRPVWAWGPLEASIRSN